MSSTFFGFFHKFFPLFLCKTENFCPPPRFFPLTKEKVERIGTDTLHKLQFSYASATASTSTSTPLGSAETATQERAGLPVKYFA